MSIHKNTWMAYCMVCNKNHVYILQPCPSCGVHLTPQPKSENVCKRTLSFYECDGCEAYRDHLK